MHRVKRLAFISITLLIRLVSHCQSPKELTPILEVPGADSGAALGYYVKGVGDLNKDGYADVAVCTPYIRKTYIFKGGRPMSSVPALTLEGGGAIVSGDFNDDGWRDLAVEKWFTDTVLVYLGGLPMDTIPDLVLHGEHNGDLFGHVLGSGDLNGDGADELVISAQLYV